MSKSFPRGRSPIQALCACAFVLSLAARAANGVAPPVSIPVQLQTPTAQSIGTTISLPEAAEAMLAAFELVARHHTEQGSSAEATITGKDLKRVLTPGSLIPIVQDAAKFYLVSAIDQELAADGQGLQGLRTGMTKAGLLAELRLASSGGLEQALLNMAGKDGSDATSENRFYTILLKDPGIPTRTRTSILARLSDGRLADILGRFNIQGSGAQDGADVTSALVSLSRLSWLGAAEAEALSLYKVPVAVLRGSQDQNVSSWDGRVLYLSDNVLTGKITSSGQKHGYQWEQLARAVALAIYQDSQLEKQMVKDVTAGMAQDLAGLSLIPVLVQIYEATFAGAFEYRTHVAFYGFNDNPDIDRRLILVNGLQDNITGDTRIDPLGVRARLLFIQSIMAKDMVPFLQRFIGLYDDPQLVLLFPPVINLNAAP